MGKWRRFRAARAQRPGKRGRERRAAARSARQNRGLLSGAAGKRYRDPGNPARIVINSDKPPQTAAAASARVSQRSRTVSSAALSTVKVHAVIHAEPASGSAAPSMITAT